MPTWNPGSSNIVCSVAVDILNIPMSYALIMENYSVYVDLTKSEARTVASIIRVHRAISALDFAA